MARLHRYCVGRSLLHSGVVSLPSTTWVEPARLASRSGGECAGHRSDVTGRCIYKRSASAEAQTGPHTWEELYGFARSGLLGPQDCVWHPQLPGWQPAFQMPGLFETATEQTAGHVAPGASTKATTSAAPTKGQAPGAATYVPTVPTTLAAA